MRRNIRVRGEQKETIELKRLAHALLQAARELAQADKLSTAPVGPEEPCDE